MVAQKRTGNSILEIVAFIISFAFMFGFKYLPPIGEITTYGMAVLGIFIGVVIGWCASGNQTIWASLLGIFALGINMPAGVYYAASQVLSSYVFILTFFPLFMVGALMGANIAEYLVYRILTLKFVQGKAWVLMAVIMYGSYIVAALTNPIVVAIFLFALLETLFEQVGYKQGDKTPTLIIISIAIEILIVSNLYPWSAPQLMALSALSQGTGITVANSSYLLFVLCLSVLLIAGCLVMMKLLRCDMNKMAQADLAFLNEKYKNGLSKYQKSVLTAMLIYVIGAVVIAFFPKSFGSVTTFVTASVSFAGWSVFVAAIMMFVKVEGKTLIEPRSMAAYFPWDMLMMIGFAICIGTILTAEDTGVTAWVGTILGPILGGTNEITLYIMISIITLLLTNVLNNNAVIILMSTVVVTLTTQGFIAQPIVPIILTIISGNMGFVTPAASIYGAMIHSHKYVTASSAYKYTLIMLIYVFAFLMLCVIPIGNLIF